MWTELQRSQLFHTTKNISVHYFNLYRDVLQSPGSIVMLEGPSQMLSHQNYHRDVHGLLVAHMKNQAFLLHGNQPKLIFPCFHILFSPFYIFKPYFSSFFSLNFNHFTIPPVSRFPNTSRNLSFTLCTFSHLVNVVQRHYLSLLCPCIRKPSYSEYLDPA